MELIVTELNITKALATPIVVNGVTLNEITVKRLAIRPFLKRIVFGVKELDRIVIYEGEELFEAHRDDSVDTLVNKLLEVVSAQYSA